MSSSSRYPSPPPYRQRQQETVSVTVSLYMFPALCACVLTAALLAFRLLAVPDASWPWWLTLAPVAAVFAVSLFAGLTLLLAAVLSISRPRGR